MILVGLGISHRQSKPFIDLRIYRVSRGDSGKLNVCGVFRRHELIFELPSHSPSAPLLSRPALLLLSACGSYDFRSSSSNVGRRISHALRNWNGTQSLLSNGSIPTEFRFGLSKTTFTRCKLSKRLAKT